MNRRNAASQIREELRVLSMVRRLLPEHKALLVVLERTERRLRRLYQAPRPKPETILLPGPAPDVVPPNAMQRREPVDPGIAVFVAMAQTCARRPK